MFEVDHILSYNLIYGKKVKEGSELKIARYLTHEEG